MNFIELNAPAKINLLLKILNKRKDSYHNLLTIFERISLADKIRISRIDSGVIVTSDRHITNYPQDNIVHKAARLILEKSKVNGGVKIHIRKRIPMAAGLGGGSSDAAAVLMGINKLFKLNIRKDKLMRLGAKLGADVPFFIFDAPFAAGKGIGDRLERLNYNKKLYHLLVYPGFKASTKDIYSEFDRMSRGLTNRTAGAKIRLPNDPDSLDSLIYNDLEAVLISKKPVIGKIIRCLASSLGRRVVVSGSGSSLFCLYRTRREAIGARRKLFSAVPERFRERWQIFIVETKMFLRSPTLI